MAIKQKGEEMMKKGDETARMAEEEAMKALEVAKSKFMEAEKAVNEQIKQDPGKAVMIAAGIGAAIGTILTLALTKKK